MGAVLALPLAQCTLVTPVSGLSGGADAGDQTETPFPGSDSGAPGSDASLPLPHPSRYDAGADALAAGGSEPDAIAPTDATASMSPPTPTPADAADDVAVDAAPSPLFSDSFDTPGALPRGWATMDTSDGALAIDSSRSVSPPNSVAAKAGALAAGAPGNAANVTLRQSFAMPAAGATVAYDFSAYVAQYDQANNANSVIAALQIGDAEGNLYELQLDLALESTGAFKVVFAEYAGFFDGGSSYVGHPVANTFPATTWTAVRIELDSSAPPIARVYFDGNLAIETSITIPITGTFTQISLGLSYVSAPSQAWAVNYDDAAYWQL